MRMERRDLAVCGDSNNMEGRGEMKKAPISLQDLRRSLYVKAKAEPAWRFWGLYVHVCKMETLHEAYRMAKSNNGAPGMDGVTFEAIEESGEEGFLRQIQDELVTHTYRPMRARRKEIPKDGGKVRVLSIPAIRDRVVQGAMKLILEPIFEADFQSGSYGYRPKRTAHQAVNRVAQAIVEEKTRIVDIDLSAYFDNVQHYLLLEKVAKRVDDDEVMQLLKTMLKATGKKGVPQGGVISPLLSNVYLTEVDRMLEKAITTTRRGQYTHVQYARFADDLVILIDSHPRHDWLVRAVEIRLREELAKLRVAINEEKSRMVDLSKEEKFSFLGFEFPPHFEPQQEVASTLRAQAQETDGAVGKTQGDLPTVCEPTRRQSDRTDQSDPARLGELLCSGTLEPMFFDDRRLGGEEDSAAPDACPATQRIRLETVE